MKRKEIEDEISLDLVVEILTRLPYKSLIKFQCVSKIWYSIIRSKGFIDSYLSMSLTQSQLFIVAFTNGVFARGEERRFFIFSGNESSSSSSSSLVTTTNHDMTIPSLSICNNPASRCVSVHGFIGSSLLSGEFLVCNPTTRQVIVLPISPSRLAPDVRGKCLGYDPVDDQFKALSLMSSRLPNHDCVEHMVLTLLKGGDKKEYKWRQIQSNNNIPPYSPVTMKLCINGVVYYGAWTPKHRMNPVIVCFDVRSEKLSFIKAPKDVVFWLNDSVLMEYKGKLASIVRYPYDRFHTFDLWILEDVEKHEWSKQTCVFPLSLWDYVPGSKMSFPGTNKAGEIILAPTYLSHHLQPFYVFYYHVGTNNIRRVRLEGIADDQEFRRCYGIANYRDSCNVYISPEHVQNLTFL